MPVALTAVKMRCEDLVDATCDRDFTLMNDADTTALACTSTNAAVCEDTDAGVALTTSDKWTIFADETGGCDTTSRPICYVQYY